MERIYLSVIVPFFNEEENLPQLHNELTKVLGKLKKKSEIIYVNDGSSDRSLKILRSEIADTKTEDLPITVVDFRKNYGQTAAVAAGIKYSKGKFVSFLDADLQNDPADIPLFLKRIEKDYDAVFGWRKMRKDATVRSVMSKLANRIINFIFSYPHHDVGCSARVVRREYLENLELYGELHRIMPVLIYLKGAKIAEVVVRHRERAAGKSKYGFERIVKTMIDIITVKFLSSYRTKPAYVFGGVGLGSLFVAGATLLTVAYRKLFLGVFVHRDPLFLIAIFFGLLGVQFIMMGLLAELQVRTYFSSNKRDIYEVRSVHTNL